MKVGDLVRLTKGSIVYESSLYDGIKDDLMIIAEDPRTAGDLFYVLHPESASVIPVSRREVRMVMQWVRP